MLKTILEQYRNGERGLPTYDELAAIADESSAKRAINAAIDELAREPGAVGFMHSLPPHHTRYVAGGSLDQIVSMARRRKDEGLASIAGGDHDGHARINAGVYRAPVAWVRYCSDGTFDGPIMDTDIRMAGARRASGAWTPLYAHPSAEPCRADNVIRKPRLDTAEMLEMRITEAMTRLDEAKAEVKELRHALAIARDQMRFMANWFRHSSPAEHRFAESAITIVNAVLERGEPK
ncbi:hypothetical protein KMC51_gp49 [Ralstonia phage Gervaise]|uniref:Uncharacterized protein n=1 Tax=Ralstonia phage Gervaise TaxID=2759728 RepID=A0A7G5BAI5_9CAUD|nr:hypothetical protein KMC51_gp49 [Ralstonia phage Gervaise]QMV33308.1 hypothetical protein 1Ca_00071 [Ralstonia phage Gervaise]